MKKTNIFLAVTAALTLAACGGGGSSSGGGAGGGSVATNTTPITVIDGYLGNAEIYADVNADGVADANELQGTTDVNGVFELDDDMLTYDVIAKAVVGKTTDSDKFGELATGFEFIAPAGDVYVTPFSTLAVKNGAAVDYPAGYDVAGDYIANGDKKAHALARAVTVQIAKGETDQVIADLYSIASVIDGLPAEELDTALIDNDSGDYLATQVKASQEFLKGKTLHSSSINIALRISEDVGSSIFNEEGTSIIIESGESVDITYPTNTSFKYGSESPDEIFYASTNSNKALMLSSQTSVGDLTVSSSVDYSTGLTQVASTFTEEDFIGKTMYLLFDDSTTESADPTLAKAVFGQNTLQFSERVGTSYGNSETFSWSIQGGNLAIDTGDSTMTYYNTQLSNNDFFVTHVTDPGANVPSGDAFYLLSSNEVLINKVYNAL